MLKTNISTDPDVQQKLQNVYVLSYDGVVTGSQELRCYNFDVVSKQYNNYEGELIDYYNKYDNHPAGKSNEPFFDGFLAHMAFLNTGDESNKQNYGLENINYYEIDYVDSEEKNENWNSKLMTTKVDSNNLIPNFREKTNYNRGEHIFLLCPTSKEVYKEISSILDDRIKNDITDSLFIHIQGEAINSGEKDSANGKPIPRDIGQCPDTGMTGSGGGLFGEAFNLFSSGLEIQKLRRKLTDMGAKTYSVKPDCKDYIQTQQPTSNAGKCKLEGEYKLPNYYIEANKDILGFSDPTKVNETVGENKFLNLNIKKVFQDITDKDNLASLAIIGKLKNKGRIPLMLVGFRIYESNSIPFGDDGGRAPTLKFPPPLNIRQNPQTKDWEKPGDIDNKTQNGKYGNINYLKEETIDFYNKSTAGFMGVLETILPETFIMEDGGIADGQGTSSESLRSPFNMSLYFFAPDTYMNVGVGQENGKLIKGVKRNKLESNRGGLCETDIDCVDQKNKCIKKKGKKEGQCEYSGGGRKLKKKTLKKKSNLKGGKKQKNNSKKRKNNKSNKKTKNNKNKKGITKNQIKEIKLY
jgi:hypothetical protein